MIDKNIQNTIAIMESVNAYNNAPIYISDKINLAGRNTIWNQVNGINSISLMLAMNAFNRSEKYEEPLAEFITMPISVGSSPYPEDKYFIGTGYYHALGEDLKKIYVMPVLSRYEAGHDTANVYLYEENGYTYMASCKNNIISGNMYIWIVGEQASINGNFSFSNRTYYDEQGVRKRYASTITDAIPPTIRSFGFTDFKPIIPMKVFTDLNEIIASYESTL